jgi:hypothetical protein
VRRVREVEPTAKQWRLGGGPADINHTRVIDLAFADEETQEALLSGYPSATTGSIEVLRADDFPLIPIITP